MRDAYSRWLGVPDRYRPPTYYQLLGIAPSELDYKVIAAAVDRQLARLTPLEFGSEREECQRIIQEVTLARDTLLDPVSRQRYDILTPDATAPWWNPGMDEIQITPPIPREGWWQSDGPDSTPPNESTEPSTPTVTTVAKEGWWEGQTPEPDLTASPSVVENGDVTKDTVPPPLPSAAADPPPSSPAAKSEDWWKKTAGATDLLDADPATLTTPISGSEVSTPAPAPVSPAELPPIHSRPILSEKAMSYTAPERAAPARWLALGLAVIALIGVGILVWKKPWEKIESPSDEKQLVLSDPKSERKKKDESPIAAPPSKADPESEAIEITPRLVEGKVAKVEPKPKKEPKVPTETSEFTEALTLGGHQGAVYGLAVTRSTKTILSISDDRNVLQYSPREAGKHDMVHRLLSPGVAVTLCNEDRDAVFCDGCDIVVFDLATRKNKAAFENPRGGVKCLAPAIDGSFVLTGSTDGCVRWWGVSANSLSYTLDVDAKEGVTAIAIAPDARSAVFGLSDGRLCLWDLQKRRELKRWKAHKDRVTALAFSPDGKRLASAGDDNLACIWQSSGTLVHKLSGHTEPVLCVGWCSDGQRVVTGGIDKEVRLWDETKGWKSDWKSPTSDKIFSIAIDARDRFVLIGLSTGSIRLLPLPRATKESDN